LSYSAKFNKSYGGSLEFKQRKANYLNADKEIKAFNSKKDRGATLAHNPLSDWSRNEKQALASLSAKDLKN